MATVSWQAIRAARPPRRKMPTFALAKRRKAKVQVPGELTVVDRCALPQRFGRVDTFADIWWFKNRPGLLSAQTPFARAMHLVPSALMSLRAKKTGLTCKYLLAYYFDVDP